MRIRRRQLVSKRAPSNPTRLSNLPIARGVVACWPNWQEMGTNAAPITTASVHDISKRQQHLIYDPGSDGAENWGSLRQSGFIDFPNLLGMPEVIDVDEGSSWQEGSQPIEGMNGDVSFACWFCLQDLGNVGNHAHILLGYTSGAGETEAENYQFGIWFDIAEILTVFHEYSTGANETHSMGSALTIGTPAHIVCTRNVTTKTYTIYKDGVLESSGTYTNQPSGGEASSKIIFGATLGAALPVDRGYNGQYAFPTLWTRCLTAREAFQVYSTWDLFATPVRRPVMPVAAAAGGQPTMRRWGGVPGMNLSGRGSW